MTIPDCLFICAIDAERNHAPCLYPPDIAVIRDRETRNGVREIGEWRTLSLVETRSRRDQRCCAYDFGDRVF